MALQVVLEALALQVLRVLRELLVQTLPFKGLLALKGCKGLRELQELRAQVLRLQDRLVLQVALAQQEQQGRLGHRQQ